MPAFAHPTSLTKFCFPKGDQTEAGGVAAVERFKILFGQQPKTTEKERISAIVVSGLAKDDDPGGRGLHFL